MSKENITKIAMTFIDIFNANDLSRWSNALADDFTAEYPVSWV